MYFYYDVTGPGWARATVADDASHVELTASYLGDALGGLLAAVGQLLEGAQEARCSWFEEPGESRWIFEQSEVGTRVRILAFPDDVQQAEDGSIAVGDDGHAMPMPDSVGKCIFETDQRTKVLASAIIDGAQDVLERYGLKEYQKRWIENPFPEAHLALAKGLL
ncbi:hypothetical protein M2152_001337 [Microbacteriaceae bacterium SG_E_30_P1]|uniref:Uncharacterized protein n=1 Tax=Antiquaquibacter oligotrophicus TaxID=2880260 RepID=A0ABT6KMC1_9MICO|nr:hypothetical protein [Antiquaquibacter oligotrophicus]MDH6181155.1 hypothetical protein [Antiquaquibacter oligotrophicus]UDF13149.1 hypothetical protein LH407_13455 [Antiquaquibacter oligotrophicus]